MTIQQVIKNLYKNPAHQGLLNFIEAARPRRILEADNTRRYMRFQNIGGGTLQVFFGNEPASAAELASAGGVTIQAVTTTGDILEISGEGIWKGEVWATSTNVGSVLKVLAYGNQPHPWPGV